MLPSLGIRVSPLYPTRYGGRGSCLFLHGGRFDRPWLKCYKSAFCAALALRLRGASPGHFRGKSSVRRAAASSWWNVTNSCFARAQRRSVEKVCRKHLCLGLIGL